MIARSITGRSRLRLFSICLTRGNLGGLKGENINTEPEAW
jgi:hypothetical protein